LGWGAEYWLLDSTEYEGSAELGLRYAALGRRVSKRELALRLSGNLLDDVLVAAGGVEHAIEVLRRAVEGIGLWIEEQEVKADHLPWVGISTEATKEAWYALADVVSWARIFEERLERPSFRKKGRNQGLVPAIRPVRLRKRAVQLLDHLRGGPIGETRFVANFTLHAALVQSPFSGARLDSSGVITLLIPDAPVAPIAHWDLFTWNDERDGIAFAECLWQAVQEFVDDLLTAFEKAVPKRLRS